LDEVLSGNNRGDERDRVLLSGRPFYAIPWGGYHIAFGLAVAIYARYGRHLAGAWRKIYVIGAVIALYLNVFVGIVQSFQKIPALKAMAPTQSEPPFKFTQLVVLALFVLLTIVAAIRFRDEPAGAP
jgi:hypothetical protein